MREVNVGFVEAEEVAVEVEVEVKVKVEVGVEVKVEAPVEDPVEVAVEVEVVDACGIEARVVREVEVEAWAVGALRVEALTRVLDGDFEDEEEGVGAKSRILLTGVVVMLGGITRRLDRLAYSRLEVPSCGVYE